MKQKNLIQKYPKIIILILIIGVSYLVFSNPQVIKLVSNLSALEGLGTFIAGMLYSFGFTSPISAGFFLSLNTEKILLMGLIGGLGAMISDLLIFRFVKISFKEEFQTLKKEKFSIKLKNFVKKIIPKKIRVFLTYLFAGIFIASPLPDEMGISIIAGLSKIKENIFAIISFILNTVGIIVLLAIK